MGDKVIGMGRGKWRAAPDANQTHSETGELVGGRRDYGHGWWGMGPLSKA